MNVNMLQPPEYDEGIYQIEIRITPKEQECLDFANGTFEIPSLPHRRLSPDNGYRAANIEGNTSKIEGVFKDGLWKGHCYSSDVPEAENPTPMKEVCDALETSITSAIGSARLWREQLARPQ